jgi:hypothetical protein
MSKYLFELEQRNRLSQRGLLKRFGPKCIGKQETMENIRAKKTTKFLELQKKKGSREYEKYFLKYTPGESKKESKNSKESKSSKEKSKKESKNSKESKSSKEKSKKEPKEKSANKTVKKRRISISNLLRGF